MALDDCTGFTDGFKGPAAVANAIPQTNRKGGLPQLENGRAAASGALDDAG